MAIINGRQYEYADLTLILAGRDVIGFRGIDYKSAQEKEVVYGKGNKPLAIQKGNFSHDGSIQMLQSEYETLVELGNGSVLGLDLNATLVYGGRETGGTILTDRIFGLQFTEEAKSFKQNDKFAEISLPFIALDIKRHR
jgi:hypothetical protein